MKKDLEHCLNPLNLVYRPLRKITNKNTALLISRGYEKAIFRPVVSHLLGL